MRRAVAAGLVTLMVLVGSSPVRAGTREVEVDDNVFRPESVRLGVGDRVHWSRADGSANPHNVREEGSLFRSGAPTVGGIDYTVTFSSGTFFYYCEFHGRGMSGYVRVPVRISSGPAGLPFTVRWATAGSATGSVHDVQFRVGSGNWRTWKTDTASHSAVFGRYGRPVRVADGTTYRFRARSQSGSEVSRWSPPRSFTP